ncbi:MAG TPA: D-2-hydroxyacid dehydrogenase [Prolixibacteraceae bacterium]|nr:D-2-hydroxyacid dehydrogenase [Prolixibacteraceae bacterium]HPR61078.1 D-2-hydroxyacid dehydrogenase [Prolixibacteraceae bacterium]
MKKLVVLDGFTLNPGDLSWKAFEDFCDVVIYERTPSTLTLERSIDADYVFTNKVVFDANTLAQLPKLKYIGVLATGYNVVDFQAAKNHNIVVTNIPAYSTNSVAQLIFAHIFAHYNKIEKHSQHVHKGGWQSAIDFSYFLSPQTELAGKIMGIIGYGKIGSTVAKIALAFGMKVLIANRSVKNNLPENVTQVSIEEVFSASDIVSINCPLTENNIGFVNHELIGLMKPTALLINTGRGPLINEADLAAALNKETIAGASLDVLSTEPPAMNNPLIGAKNCIITPHIAWATYEARTRLMNIAYENLKAFINGTAQNVVS